MDLQNYLKKFITMDNLIKELESTNIKIKSDNELALLYIPFRVDQQNLTEIEKMCRSVIIEKSTLNVIAYSYPVILYNDYVTLTNCEINQEKKLITESIEGTLLTMYYYNEWRVSTRKCLNAGTSFWKSTKSHLDLFKSTLTIEWENFCDLHNKDYIYTYILVHHENKQLIDYTERFGENYKKIIKGVVRDTKTYKLVNETIPFVENVIETPYYTDYSFLDKVNENDDNLDIITKIKNEGLLISFIGETTETYIKLHSNSYKIYFDTTLFNYTPLTSQFYISLYQNDKLDIYLNKFVGEMFYTNKYQIKGLIDNIFKLLTSELLFLFKYFWDIKFGTQKTECKDIYLELPTEYKKFFYQLRGLYFKKKLLEDENKYITIKVVYEMLKKTLSPDTLINLLQDRNNILKNNVKLAEVLNTFHKTEIVAKLVTNSSIAIDFCLERKATHS